MKWCSLLLFRPPKPIYIYAMKHTTYIGAHTSIAGGIHLAFQRAAEIGANTLQIFAKSPRGRSLPTISDEDIELACQARSQYKQV